MSHYGRPEYSAVRCLLFGANLTDVGILRYVCLLFPDGKNILALLGGCVFCIPTRPRPSTMEYYSMPLLHLFLPNLGGSARILDKVHPISTVRHISQLN